MRKRTLGWAVILPAAHVMAAVVMLYVDSHSTPPHGYHSPYVSTARMILMGLNAPCVLVWGLSLTVLTSISPSLYPGIVFGVAVSDLMFLADVLVLWYLVGRAVDRRGASQSRGLIEFLVPSLLLVVGAVLSWLGLHDLHEQDRPYRGLLMLLWAVSLIFVSVERSIRMARRLRASV